MRVLKWLGIVLGAIVIVAFGAFMYFKSAAQARLDKTYDIQVDSIPIPYPLTPQELAVLRKERQAAAPASAPAPTEAAAADGGVAEEAAAAEPAPAAADPIDGVDLKAIARERAIARGKHYVLSRAGCSECHGADFGGKVVIDNPAMGSWIAPNITRGGVTKTYKPVDWVRIIRHGLKPDNRPATMPSQDFTWFSDQEIADIATYISTRPPVDRVMPISELGPIYAMLIATGKMPLAADTLDHTTPRAKLPPAIAPTLELGKHLGLTCVGCHGPGLSGGEIIGGDPAWPAAKNITFHETGLAKWSLEDFKKALSTGVRPDGIAINPVMPIAFTAQLKPSEVDALYLYLQTVEKKPFGNH